MVSVINTKYVNGHKKIVEIVGLSADSKPVNPWQEKISNGSTYFEMDTKKAYMFDESGNKWWEV